MFSYYTIAHHLVVVYVEVATTIRKRCRADSAWPNKSTGPFPVRSLNTNLNSLQFLTDPLYISASNSHYPFPHFTDLRIPLLVTDTKFNLYSK